MKHLFVIENLEPQQSWGGYYSVFNFAEFLSKWGHGVFIYAVNNLQRVNASSNIQIYCRPKFNRNKRVSRKQDNLFYHLFGHWLILKDSYNFKLWEKTKVDYGPSELLFRNPELCAQYNQQLLTDKIVEPDFPSVDQSQMPFEVFGMPPKQALCFPLACQVSDLQIFRSLYKGYVDYFPSSHITAPRSIILNPLKRERDFMLQNFSGKLTAQCMENNLTQHSVSLSALSQ